VRAVVNSTAKDSADSKDGSSGEAEAKPEDDSTTKSSKAQPKGGKTNNPAWAMSEKQATDTKDDDLDMTKDESALLDFASSLSFDKFIGDIEVKSIVERLKKRITDLERDVTQENQRTVDAEERAIKRELLAAMVSSLHFCVCRLPSLTML
jgi:hypothetical protein